MVTVNRHQETSPMADLAESRWKRVCLNGFFILRAFRMAVVRLLMRVLVCVAFGCGGVFSCG
uniref:Uncharacterized protein n=1 Tax=Rhizophora mucronata TaxID=61149 RepID=A0A2P2JJW5_RHIMU